jgi:hypothetical protein
VEAPQSASVIPSQDSLIGDLLSMDINPPMIQSAAPASNFGAVDLLGGGLDALVSPMFDKLGKTDRWLYLNSLLTLFRV